MIDYKKIILNIAFAIVVILLWLAWQHDYSNHHPAVVAKNQQLPSGTTSIDNNQSPPALFSETKANVGKQQPIVVKTDVLKLLIDPQGGRIIEARLIKYPETLHSKESTLLLSQQKPMHYSATSFLLLNNKRLHYVHSQSNYSLAKGENTLQVVLNGKTNDGVVVEKIFTFKRDSYLIHVNYKLTNHTDKPKTGHIYFKISHAPIAPSRDKTFRMHTFYGFATWSKQNHYQSYKFKHLLSQPINQSTEGGWLAMTQHYFLTAWLLNRQLIYHYASQIYHNIYSLAAQTPLELPVAKTINVGGDFYIGPKITDRLNAAAPSLNKTIDYGWVWLWPLSVAIFWLMEHIHSVIGNWGWSIIAVTALIKLAFWRLSAKSYRSMAGMRALQPKINALKESCADDKKKLSQEMMRLYKREKLSPVSGCLPILIQIPFFMALYWVLIASVQLRQAPFLGWIHDLSARDPIYILPILMGISMFIQQKISPPAQDPTQAKVMMLMPVFITFIFINLPVGLILYMLVNNILSISQQWWVTVNYQKKSSFSFGCMMPWKKSVAKITDKNRSKEMARQKKQQKKAWQQKKQRDRRKK